MAHLLSLAFLPFALRRGAAQCVRTVTSLSPGSYHFCQSSQAKIHQQKSSKTLWPMPPLRKKLSIDTASVYVDFALPLVFAGIWESAAGSESKVAVVGGMNSPAVMDRELCAGNTVSETDGYFSLFSISHEFQWQSKCLLFKPFNLTIQGIDVDMKL